MECKDCSNNGLREISFRAYRLGSCHGGSRPIAVANLADAEGHPRGFGIAKAEPSELPTLSAVMLGSAGANHAVGQLRLLLVRGALFVQGLLENLGG